ncbi:MAG: hypothetical protein AAGF59_15615 [Pseudomonadota bacterium]
MTGQEFQDWQTFMKLSSRKTAERLDVARDTVARYRESGTPGYIDLACMALACNLPPWPAKPAKE